MHIHIDSWGVQSNTEGTSNNSIGYTSQRLDSETGLMALGNGERYYSPTLARFIQQDSFIGSLTNAQSLNRFA
jgi:RHS repeat-associated protein